MSALADGGVSVQLPDGWDGQIRSAGQSAPELHPPSAATSGSDGPRVLHAANFALPAHRGDYGSGAVELMGGSNVLLCLLEHHRSGVDNALFAHTGIPRLHAGMFSPQSMQRAIPGMAGCQQFFQAAGRPFCLYVVVGSWHTRGPLVRIADAVVASIRVTG